MINVLNNNRLPCTCKWWSVLQFATKANQNYICVSRRKFCVVSITVWSEINSAHLNELNWINGFGRQLVNCAESFQLNWFTLTTLLGMLTKKKKKPFKQTTIKRKANVIKKNACRDHVPTIFIIQFIFIRCVTFNAFMINNFFFDNFYLTAVGKPLQSIVMFRYGTIGYCALTTYKQRSHYKRELNYTSIKYN